MTPKPSSVASIIIVVLFSVGAPAQLIIDATGPHKSSRKTTHGSGGGIGRKVPLQVAVVTQSSVPRDSGRMVVEFILTNSGEQGLDIPVSPDPDRVDPSSSTATYSFRSLSLSMREEGAMQEAERAVPGGAILYGNDKSATLVTLGPGDTIKVLVEVALPTDSGADQKGPTLRAWAAVDDVTITTVNGETSWDSREVGYATSPSYTLQALFKSLK